MSNDYLKKEPSKTERVLYELYMQQQLMDKNLLTNSAHVVALGLLLEVKPEKIAELLVSGGVKIKEYSEKLNQEIEKLQKEKEAAVK